jgi:hypothetical protein
LSNQHDITNLSDSTIQLPFAAQSVDIVEGEEEDNPECSDESDNLLPRELDSDEMLPPQSSTNGCHQHHSQPQVHKQYSESYASSFFGQLRVLCLRSLIHYSRDPHLLRGQYIMTFILSIFIGTIFWHLSFDLIGTQVREFCCNIEYAYISCRIELVACFSWPA